MHEFSPDRKRATTLRNSATITDTRLPGPVAPVFVYAHFPTDWEWVNGEYLPRVKRHLIREGVNGTRSTGKGPKIDDAINNLRSAGWIVIPDDVAVVVTGDDGVTLTQGDGYLYSYDGHKGTHYGDAWSRPMIVGAGPNAAVDWVSAYDKAGFLAWRKMLKDEGIVPPMPLTAQSRALRVQKNRASRGVGQAHAGNPHIQAKVKREGDKLADMQAKAKPKRGPGRPRKKPVSVTDGK